MYLIPKLHKKLYKQRYVHRWTCKKYHYKPLSKILTATLTAVKQGLQSYYDMFTSQGILNSMRKKIERSSGNTQVKIISENNSIKPMILNPLYFYSPYSVKIPTQKQHTSLLRPKKKTVHLDTDT